MSNSKIEIYLKGGAFPVNESKGVVKSYNKNSNKQSLYNKQVALCFKDCKIFKNPNVKDIHKSKFKTELEYQASFNDVIQFSKKISDIDKKSINAIIYNRANSDGMFSAYIVWKYLKENGKNDILLIEGRPWSGRHTPDSRLDKFFPKLKGRNVIILDLAYNKETFLEISKVANSIYVIDDHERSAENSINNINKVSNRAYIGNKHATVAYTWKFFYPNKEVPIFVQTVDNQDKSLFLPFLLYGRDMQAFVEYRIIHNPRINSFTSDKEFELLTKYIERTDYGFMSIVGHYYDEVANNIKEQVAKNVSTISYFQGYKVYILNYLDPALYKMVMRQMITEAEKHGHDIAFAVTWGYEHHKGHYVIHLSEKHTGDKPKYNLPGMAKKLGNAGGDPMGGNGKEYIGNFYWPKNEERDIWELFTRTSKFLK